jgi:hypothetical protein
LRRGLGMRLNVCGAKVWEMEWKWAAQKHNQKNTKPMDCRQSRNTTNQPAQDSRWIFHCLKSCGLGCAVESVKCRCCQRSWCCWDKSELKKREQKKTHHCAINAQRNNNAVESVPTIKVTTLSVGYRNCRVCRCCC